jgi:hypothetical protein
MVPDMGSTRRCELPPNFAVWVLSSMTLMYMLPSRALAWSSVRMAAPFIGLGNGEIVIMGSAFSPSFGSRGCS